MKLPDDCIAGSAPVSPFACVAVGEQDGAARLHAGGVGGRTGRDDDGAARSFVTIEQSHVEASCSAVGRDGVADPCGEQRESRVCAAICGERTRGPVHLCNHSAVAMHERVTAQPRSTDGPSFSGDGEHGSVRRPDERHTVVHVRTYRRAAGQHEEVGIDAGERITNER